MRRGQRDRNGKDMSLQFTEETEKPMGVAQKNQVGLQGEGNKLYKDHSGFWRASSNSGNHQVS